MAECDCPHGEGVSTHRIMTQSPYRFFKGQIMTSLDASMKYHDLVTFGDVTQHMLRSKSAEEGLINYSFLIILRFSMLYVHTLSLCFRVSRVLKHCIALHCIKLHYITLNYITLN